MRLLQTIKTHTLLAVMLAGAVTGGFPLVTAEPIAHATEGISLQEQGDGLIKNVEEMVAHGGMGDAQAIIHHCAEATRYAEMLLKQLATPDLRRDNAVISLNEVIRQCRRVSEIGVHADPGLLLNPAIKARTAAQKSIQALGLTKTSKS